MDMIWIIFFLYSLWLLIFPILLYSRLGDMLQSVKKTGHEINYIAKFISYKEIYYCPKCLKLDEKGGKCLTCGQEALKKGH
jgi:hypothetical protein